MNKIIFLCVWVVGAIVCSTAVYAADPSSNNTAVQVYRDAETPPPVSVETTEPEQANGAVAAPPPAAPAAAVAAVPPAGDLATANAAEHAALVDTQISQLNAKVEALGADAVMMQAQIKQLAHALLSLNRKISTPAAVTPAYPVYTQWLYPVLAIAGLVLVIGFAIGVAGWLIKRAKPRVKTAASDSSSADGPEYDYMGSQESVPVKLNLVRAYIAMEDFKAAKKVIADILAVGNEAQREEAQRLDASITVDQ